jgi:hypothetical protein
MSEAGGIFYAKAGVAPLFYVIACISRLKPTA